MGETRKLYIFKNNLYHVIRYCIDIVSVLWYKSSDKIVRGRLTANYILYIQRDIYDIYTLPVSSYHDDGSNGNRRDRVICVEALLILI